MKIKHKLLKETTQKCNRSVLYHKDFECYNLALTTRVMDSNFQIFFYTTEVVSFLSSQFGFVPLIIPVGSCNCEVFDNAPAK